MIDAKGHIVSSGFIDLHAHGQSIGDYRMQAIQGVTTALELKSGVLPIGDRYDGQAAKNLPINCSAAAGWTYGRIATFDNTDPLATVEYFQEAQADSDLKMEIADSDQSQRILSLVEQGLKEGGLGIGINACYAPGYGQKKYFALAELAGSNGVATYTHVRYASVIELKSCVEALKELSANAAITGAHMHICHINSTSMADTVAALALVDEAMAQGINITVETYPYGAASNVVGAAMFTGPDWRDRMQSTSENFQLGTNRMTEDELADYQTNKPGTFITWHFLDEAKPEDLAMLDLSVTYPATLIASDATFAKILRSYVRERGVLSMSDAIRKMSLMPAQTLEDFVPQMHRKGWLKVGMDVDILVFDPETVADRATFENANQRPLSVCRPCS